MKKRFLTTHSISMKYRRVFVLLVMAILILTLTPTPPAIATAQKHFQASGAFLPHDEPSPLTMGKKRVMPISGSYNTRIEPPNPINPGQFLLVIRKTGSAKPLGDFTGTLIQVADFTDFTIEGLTTFVTANGDKLKATFTGDFEQAGTVVTFDGVYVFNGGTGKYREAKGTAHFEGCADLETGIGHVEFRGMISY